MGSSSSKAGAGAGSRRPRSDTSRSRSSSCSSSCLESDGDASISKHNNNNNKEEENLNHYGDDDDRTADRPTTTTTTTTIEEEEEEEEEANDNKQNQGFFCSNSRRGGDDLCSSQSASTSLRSRFSFNFKLTRASSSNAPAPAPAPQVISYQDNHNRFSRALSVGRLRHRVLRTSSFHTQSPPTLSNSMHTAQDVHSPPREATHYHLMEHTTDFLERRRRIRSQVRALQRLGSRFENLSGHERACILAGQHRSGLCTCRMSNRARNPDDNTSARASISRIVMLAEALFEVLDEIHQQSVVLSSRPSVSSLGSIPAPKEVVESLPVKVYTKLRKHQIDDVPQCYICLVEYEEGDTMRILPCHHEFHRPCIDKWLKEIHRVCPLCRGDVCRSE